MLLRPPFIPMSDPCDKVIPMRIYEIAQATGLPSKTILADMRGMGQNILSASSKVEPIFASVYISMKGK